jgi:hypothetical protein
MAERMEVDDPHGALLFRRINEANIPPDEASLEWGVAYIRAQQAMMELLSVCTKHGRPEDGLIISHYMLELNEALAGSKKTVRVPREFVKEVKF